MDIQGRLELPDEPMALQQLQLDFSGSSSAVNAIARVEVWTGPSPQVQWLAAAAPRSSSACQTAVAGSC